MCESLLTLIAFELLVLILMGLFRPPSITAAVSSQLKAERVTERQ